MRRLLPPPRPRLAGRAAGLPAERPRQAGFTLIELMLAILILLVGIVSVAQMVPAAINTNFRNRNDSTALIAAQRELEQMIRQPLNVQNLGTCVTAPPAGHYFFCDRDGDTVALGRISALLALDTTQDGCPLTPTRQLDFTQPAINCDPGYVLNKQWVWNPTTGAMQNVEVRWRVITWHNSRFPMRKVFIAGARAGPAGQGFVVTNLQTVVGR